MVEATGLTDVDIVYSLLGKNANESSEVVAIVKMEASGPRKSGGRGRQRQPIAPVEGSVSYGQQAEMLLSPSCEIKERH